jgi:hypothetical protein
VTVLAPPPQPASRIDPSVGAPAEQVVSSRDALAAARRRMEER